METSTVPTTHTTEKKADRHADIDLFVAANEEAIERLRALVGRLD